MKKLIMFKTKGMNLDLSVSAFNPEFSFENMNLRLSTSEGNTMLSWVNEKGPAEIKDILIEVVEDGYTAESYTINGKPVGYAILNHKLIVFTTLNILGYTPEEIEEENALIRERNELYANNPVYEPDPELEFDDYIYSLNIEPRTATQEDSLPYKLVGKLLYKGHLYFSTKYPIETCVSYESEDIQKVYWTDGLNQPRMINIAKPVTYGLYNDNSFDFILELKLEEIVTVTKACGKGGAFPAGVILYALTYYLKNGQESNIFYTTPLLYISPPDRGGRPDEKIDNAFTIKVSHLDENFDYLRIYSIIRTSIDSTPLVKRIQDINIKEITSITDDAVPDDNSVWYKKTSYTDTGISGDSVDSMELLYKGGESISALTMSQKDGTLFLGNLKVIRNSALQSLDGGVTLNATDTTRMFSPSVVTSGYYSYSNQLTAFECYPNLSDTGLIVTDRSVPCSGFKKGNYYRCGVQYLYKTGKWSDPIFIEDVLINSTPMGGTNSITIPIIEGTLTSTKAQSLYTLGYRKIRAVVVYPNILDRAVVCLGVCNKALKIEATGTSTKAYLSSWFFRPNLSGMALGIHAGETTSPQGYSDSTIPYKSTNSSPTAIRQVEIQGDYQEDNQFKICDDFATLHSPDVEFDTAFLNTLFSSMKYRTVGKVRFTRTLSDIDIQTETPTIGDLGSGFIHKSFDEPYSRGIIAGLFYEDFIVDDYDSTNPKLERWRDEKSSVKWVVYPWHRTGSLNNDIERPANAGIRSARLKKKIISNLRYSETIYSQPSLGYPFDSTTMPQVFSSNEVEILKFNDKIYRGNIDTLLAADYADGYYFAFNSGTWTDLKVSGINTFFQNDVSWKTFYSSSGNSNLGLYKWNSSDSTWDFQSGSSMGNLYHDLAAGKASIRMRYKSSPHLALFSSTNLIASGELANTKALTYTAVSGNESALPIIEIMRAGDTNTNYKRAMMFGGTSLDALKENVWIPCGEPVAFSEDLASNVTFKYEWGDTYYQRWECMKTYPFTPEDLNQIIEIGSFMLETYVNIDGRYDRNRGQLMNVSPVNFNLMNPVYSQLNNFFSYKIGEGYEGDYTIYPNLITWTKTKEAGADVDAWTNITLASILELDGDKGSISKLIRLNDSLLVFQDTGIAQVLYNERALISTEDGVPIELANSGKVEGKRYISDTVGCSNKWSMINTPLGIYFMDSIGKSIYLFNGQLENLSLKKGMDSWCKKNIKYTERGWDWEFNDFIAQYDKKNLDVLFISLTQALAYSEKFDTFTSFYSYGDCPYLCWLDEYGIWLNRTYDNIESEKEITVPYIHQMGDYCTFFNDAYGYPSKGTYSMTLIGNPEPTVDKTFTTLEFRSCIDGDGIDTSNKFNFYLPFNTISVWNEYQHGKASLQLKNGFSGAMHHLKNGTSALKRKFRIWRCDIPRDNVAIRTTAPAALPSGATSELRAEYNAELLKYKVYQYELSRGIFRTLARPLDRIRNPWIYINLEKDNIESDSKMHKVEIHDIVLTYFD